MQAAKTSSNRRYESPWVSWRLPRLVSRNGCGRALPIVGRLELCRSPMELCKRRWLYHSTQRAVASSSCSNERHGPCLRMRSVL